MKLAIIETGGKQYCVTEGEELKIEKLPGVHTEGDTITFDKVLLLDDGESTKVGNPYVAGAKIEGEYRGQGRAKKILVIKFKRKTRFRKKQGHKQTFTKIKIRS